MYFCLICNKEYAAQRGVNRHMRLKHNVNNTVSYDKSVYLHKCLECNSSFRMSKHLVEHLKQHGKEFKICKLSFEDYQGFKSWKMTIEKDNNVNYILTGRRASREYYLCSRSGQANNRSCDQVFKRQLKSQGSKKLNLNCTSRLDVVQKENGVAVTWVRTHYGHEENDFQHLSLPQLSKMEIASKLVIGVTPTRILSSVRREMDMENPKRIDFLKRQDIENLRSALHLTSTDGKRHANDAVSVDLFVQECSNANSPYGNPIIFYKPQGVENNFFSVSDFCLIVMTNFQKEMLLKFGSDVVAVDGTHGLNGYDFQLVTLMVVDEFHEGFPVAFMFSSRKDTAIYEFFFENLKQEVGFILCKTFMSDMECAFYNAWEKIMGPSDHILFCSWHVDRCWQKNLIKIKRKELRTEVYKTLKVLQRETCEKTFEMALNNFVHDLLSNQETSEFGHYFVANYSNNFKKWGYCFRVHCGINTNMFLESMHKVIKYFYLERKVVRRLDRGLHAVMEYLYDRCSRRHIDLTMGKPTRWSRLNFQRHNVALKTSFTVYQNEVGVYKITKAGIKEYEVKKCSSSLCCQNVCSSCKICWHMFSCECQDFVGRTLICKHIHHIFMLESKLENTSTKVNEIDHVLPAAEFVNATNPLQSIDYELTKELNQKRITPETVRTNMASVVAELMKPDLSQMDQDILREINQKLLSILALSKCAKPSNDFSPTVECESAVKKLKIEPQIRFFSNKKKRVASATPLQYPSADEAADVKSYLQGKDVCHVSKEPANDHSYT